MAIPVTAPEGGRKSTPRTTRRRIAKVRLMRFLTGTGGRYDWTNKVCTFRNYRTLMKVSIPTITSPGDHLRREVNQYPR